MLSKSYLAAVRVGLVEFLKTSTGIQWDYYNSIITPDEGAKGAVFVSTTRPPQGINYTRMVHEAQLQLLLAHPDHQEAQSLLCDWGQHLVEILRQLSREGLYGTYRGVQLNGACYGIKTDGIKYYVQDADQRQDIPEGIALGTLQLNCEFIYESSVQLSQY